MSKSRFRPEYELLLARLIQARKDAGVTQVEVAARLGKPQSHVSKCETQEREISVTDLRLWCNAVGVPLGEFIREWKQELEAEAMSG
jgi:transcriptional regulator with XRE-family HTH domain